MQLTRGIAYLIDVGISTSCQREKRRCWGWLTWRGHCLPEWCRHIHVVPARETKLLRMVNIHAIDEGIAYLNDVGISTSCQREKRSCWGWLTWRGHCLPEWCRHIHVVPARETKLLRMVNIHAIDEGHCLPDWCRHIHVRASERSFWWSCS